MSDRHPHRPEWVRWLPAMILGVIILGVAIFGVVAVPRLTADPGPAATDQVTDLNWSVFTEEGLAYIEDARTPRIDLSDPPIAAAPLGLPASGDLTVGPHRTLLDYRLVLIASEDQANGALFVTPGFTLSTRDGRLVSLRIEERGGRDFRQTYLLVAERSADYGFTPPASARLAEAISEARNAGTPVTVRSDRGTSAGMGIMAEITCFGAGVCTVSYIVTPGLG
ncbi:hypothetical protein [Microcella frigidaquae]|uniref:Uncharacterized protein n=1 Tax=Microcella frigidaquae TaxID=424758 RepID=A0A840X7X6_9MICO|nr:hypothetical protein [Microcella frigidaquae]MBB5618663.1 hypothetical protein [Microcella frigidaquae]NHN44097.1 hypothetical protein [Microcella frigidaquae]